MVNYPKTSSFSRSSSAETLLWQKQLVPAPFYLKSISLLLISATLLFLSTIPSCMSVVGEETSEPETRYFLRRKLFSYSSPSHLTPETFVSPSAVCLCFVFFVFVSWPIETTTANLQGLTIVLKYRGTLECWMHDKIWSHDIFACMAKKKKKKKNVNKLSY